MVDNTRGGPPSRDRRPGGGGAAGAPGGGRDNRGPGGDRRGPGGPRKGGKGGFGKGPAKPVRVETYESLKELTRGEGFRIDKFVVAEKGTHRPVKTEYRLTREGLKGVHGFARLSEAQAAATAPLPEPEPEPIEEATPQAVGPQAVGPEPETAVGAADEGESGSAAEMPDTELATPAETAVVAHPAAG